MNGLPIRGRIILVLPIVLLCCVETSNTSDPSQADRDRALEAALVLPLCTLVAEPDVYDGKRVTVSGCVTTDDREFVALSDLQNACPEGGVVVIDTPSLRPEHQYRAEPDKKVCGTFTGIFRASTELYKRVLEVEVTSDLQTSASE